MGSKTKSWLALALAIVMLFGMAVPTAFAAELKPEPIRFLTGDAAKEYNDSTYDPDWPALNGATAEPLPVVSAGGSATTVKLYTDPAFVKNTTPGVWQLLATNLGGAGAGVKIAAVSSNPDAVSVATSATAGTFTFTPKAYSATPVTIKVTVTGTDFEDVWKDPYTFEGTFKVFFRPQLKASPASTEFGTGVLSKKSELVTLSSDVGEVLLKNVTTDGLPASAARSTNSTYTAGVANAGIVVADDTRVTIDRAASASQGEGVAQFTNVRVKLPDGRLHVAEQFDFPFTVVDDATPSNVRRVKVATTTPIEVARDAAKGFSLTANFLDGDGNTLTATEVDNIRFKAVVPSGAPFTVTNTDAIANIGDKLTFVMSAASVSLVTDGEYNVQIVAVNKAAANNNVIPTILSDTIKVVVKPIVLTAAPVAALNIDPRKPNGDLNKRELVVTGLSVADIDSTSVPTATVASGSDDALTLSMISEKLYITVPQTATVGDYTATVSGLTTGGYPIKSFKFDYKVINELAAPTFGNISTTYTLDLNSTNTQKITFTATGGKESTPKISSITLTKDVKNTGTVTTANPAIDAGKLTLGTPAETYAVTFTGGTIGKAVVYVEGEVDGVKIAKFPLTFNVINSAAKTANSIVAGVADPYTFKITDLARTFKPKVFLADGTTELDPKPVQATATENGIYAKLHDARNEAAAAQIVTVSVLADGTISVKPAGNKTGKAILEVGYGKVAVGGAITTAVPPTYVNVEVAAVDYTLNQTELVYDLINAKNEITLTLTNDTADFTDSDIKIGTTSIVGAAAGAGAPNLTATRTFSGKTVTYVIKPLATTEVSGQVSISAKIGDIIAPTKTLKYTVKSTAGLKEADGLAKIKLDLAAEATTTKDVIMVSNPAATLITSISVAGSNDVVSITKSGSTLAATAGAQVRLTFKGLQIGSGIATVTGTMAGKTVTYLIEYEVVNSKQDPVVNVTLDPASILVGGTSTVKYTLTNATKFDADPTISVPLGSTIASYADGKLTGLAAGTVVVTVSGKINGIERTGTATLTVTTETPVGEAVAIIIDGVTYPLDKQIVLPVTPNESSLGTLVDKDGNVIAIVKVLDYIYSSKPIYTSDKATIAQSRTITNKIFAADIRNGVFYYKAKAVGYWMVELQLSNNKTCKIYFQNVDENVTDVTIPTIPTLHEGERFDLRGALDITPATGNRNKLKYAVQKNGVLSVTVTGILKANKAGSAKVQVKSKSGKVLATQTITVDTDYSKINFASAYFFQDNNTDKDKVVKILADAQFTATTVTHPPYEVKATSAAGLKQELTTLASTIAASGTLDRDDIFTFYYSGNVTTKGITFTAGGDVLTFDELAIAAGALPCQVFMVFDCDYAGSFISKGAIQNAAFKAVAKQNAVYAKTVGSAGNGKAKLHLLLATSTLDETIATVPATGAQKELTKAFVAALGRGTDGKLGMGGYSVNLYNLHRELNRTADTSKATIGMYPLPRNGDAYPIYAIQELLTNP